MTKKNKNVDVEKTKEKWELLGFTDRYHYQGFNCFNGLDSTPYQEEERADIDQEDLSRLLAIYGMEDEEMNEDDFIDNSTTDASFVSDYVGSNTTNNDY